MDQIYGQRTKLKVLRFLVLSGGGHNGREIARRIGISPMTCHDVLAELLSHGILDRQGVGRAYLYTLRDEHVLVKNVLRPAFQCEAKLLESYTEELREALRSPVLSLILFGSMARQEEEAGSDVDLLAIVPAEEDVEALEDEAAERAYDLAMRYGNSPQLAVLSSQRFRRAAEDREAFAQEVLRTGRVVHGLPFTELLSFQWPQSAKEFMKRVQVSTRDIQQGGAASERITPLAAALGFFEKCTICSEETLDVEGFLEYLQERFEFTAKQLGEIQVLLEEIPASRGNGLCPYHDHQLSKDD